MMCSLKLLFNDYLFFVNVLIFAFFFFLRLKVDGREIQIKYSSIIWTLMYNNVANKVCIVSHQFVLSMGGNLKQLRKTVTDSVGMSSSVLVLG